ncbi:hypothetical protein GLOIN_2v1885597 [Rhizophagus irregularis DAOM 181602=DAOM 197198]|uniref:Crinkler family protein n=1 Tax=Rhizophagus irregularis (strain DAOM 181602 / DAOM 197198 / MUCL 43194) TaxID=747089 RepID=A0A2P4P050_RHIID|nr:hypothetical protein GLOIN_2v1885597 [Rhizophagus irregularis DAOM 181602=DAOM 197198]POG58755.1 hypothetical protein GLOIN_2v1885597 [Rhizophagus irregularis DAOM 181602=DAOM 197198]|eukprot:XP_025165621.1 hypothetical protein GLOIN_2v1885597 [Rhizophagus irregularis DAOM 181602=DAOM 197198]
MPRRYQEEKAPEFDNFATDKLKLWKVDISFEENKKLELVNTKINANIKEDLGSEELSPLSKISKHFTFQPADISSYSVLLRRRKFTAPQQDEHIVINRECVIGKEIVCLVDDEDLASIIWTQGFKIDLPIVVDTSQQPFFVVDKSRRYSDIGARFGMKHKTCIHVTSANEATRREFISSVLHGVASCYDGEVKVCPEYELSGSHGKGPRNKKKRTYNEALREDVMYGIVSTGVDWVIIKLVTTGEYNDSDNGNVEKTQELVRANQVGV